MGFCNLLPWEPGSYLNNVSDKCEKGTANVETNPKG